MDWKWLYVIAGSLCTLLIIMAYKVDYPEFKASDVNAKKGSHFVSSLNLLKKPYSMGFSIGAFLYVAAESAIYVWMPSYLVCDASSLEDTFACYASNGQQMLAMYAVAVFFSLRAAGRFVGIWMMQRFNWALVLMLFSGAILVCFVGGLIGGREAALYLFPLTGIFMFVIYPTFNSKGISCFPKAEHGSVAGVILFFTAAEAAVGPLVMGIISDAYDGEAKYGFMVATGLAAVLFAGLVYNYVFNPTEARLAEIEKTGYL